MFLRRFFTVASIGILLAGILSDPYTFARDGSDLISPIPVWQAAFAILDISVLLAVGALSIRGKFRGAVVLSVIETVFYLTGNAVLLLRDGSMRFAHGFGAESNLSEHVIVLALRIVLITYLSIVSSRRFSERSSERAA